MCRNQTSTTTRIATHELWICFFVTETSESRNQTSTTTRIATPILLFKGEIAAAPIVETKHPLQQGLRLGVSVLIVLPFNVETKHPLQQGLRHLLLGLRILNGFCRNQTSTTTRIATLSGN